MKVDENAGSITLRNKKTGEVQTVTYARAEGSSSGATAPNLPHWVPRYPGASVEFLALRRRQSGEAAYIGATFLFTTHDASSNVRLFYEQQIKELGLQLETSADHSWDNLHGTDKNRDLTVSFNSEEPGQIEIHLDYEERQ